MIVPKRRFPNNDLIAHRFQTDEAIDDVIDRLRLLKRPGHDKLFLAVERP
jgi:hypothetical protein